MLSPLILGGKTTKLTTDKDSFEVATEMLNVPWRLPERIVCVSPLSQI